MQKKPQNLSSHTSLELPWSSNPGQVIPPHCSPQPQCQQQNQSGKNRTVLKPLRGLKKKQQNNKDVNEQNTEMSQNLLGITTVHLQDSSQTPEKYFTLSPITAVSPLKCHLLPCYPQGFPDLTLRGRKAGTGWKKRPMKNMKILFYTKRTFLWAHNKHAKSSFKELSIITEPSTSKHWLSKDYSSIWIEKSCIFTTVS